MDLDKICRQLLNKDASVVPVAVSMLRGQHGSEEYGDFIKEIERQSPDKSIFEELIEDAPVILKDGKIKIGNFTIDPRVVEMAPESLPEEILTRVRESFKQLKEEMDTREINKSKIHTVNKSEIDPTDVPGGSIKVSALLEDVYLSKIAQNILDFEYDK